MSELEKFVRPAPDGYDPTDHPSSVLDEQVSTPPISGTDDGAFVPPRKTLASQHWHLQVFDERDLPDIEDPNGGNE